MSGFIKPTKVSAVDGGGGAHKCSFVGSYFSWGSTENKNWTWI